MWFSSRPQHYITNFQSPANFREMLGACQKRIYMFCRPRGKYMVGVLVKNFGGCCGSTVLTGASCWPSNYCIPAQKIVSVSTELKYNRSLLVLYSTMVCAVTSPFRSSYQGSPNYGPGAKSEVQSHFTRPQSAFCQ